MLDASPEMSAISNSFELLKELHDTLVHGAGDPRANRTPRISDLNVFLIFSLFLFIVNWGIRLGVVEPISRRLLSSSLRVPRKFKSLTDCSLRNEKTRIQKFSQTILEQVYLTKRNAGFFLLIAD
jgi:hypothetical protein